MQSTNGLRTLFSMLKHTVPDGYTFGWKSGGLVSHN
eukprot:SAG31_NODE_35537_length_322_cov_0.690583_2_plen_35_part_01